MAGTIVVPEYLPEPHVARLGAVAAVVVYDPDMHTDRGRLLESMRPAVAVLIRNRTRIDRELLAAAPELAVVGRLGVGLDNIDMAACREAGVSVIPATGGNAVAVAEYVMGAMLHLVRGVFDMTPSMVAGHWPRQGHAFGRELSGKTLGLVGLGAIARTVASRSSAFSMRVIAYDPYVAHDDPVWESVESVGLDELLATADVVSIHTPLTDDTSGLIDAGRLATMKPDAVLVNTSRGGIVDEAAVADALRRGALGGAALDVFAVEPLRGEAAAAFADLDNVLLSPHLAGNSREAVDGIAATIVAAVIDELGSRVDLTVQT